MIRVDVLIETLKKVLTNFNNFKKLSRLDALLMTRTVHLAFNTKLVYFENYHVKDMVAEKYVKANIESDYPVAVADNGNSISVVKVANKNEDYYKFLFDGIKDFEMNESNLNNILEHMSEYQFRLSMYNFD